MQELFHDKKKLVENRLDTAKTGKTFSKQLEVILEWISKTLKLEQVGEEKRIKKLSDLVSQKSRKAKIRIFSNTSQARNSYAGNFA